MDGHAAGGDDVLRVYEVEGFPLELSSGGRWAARNLFRSVQVVPVLTSASRPGLALLPRPAAPGPVVGVERRFPEPS